MSPEVCSTTTPTNTVPHFYMLASILLFLCLLLLIDFWFWHEQDRADLEAAETDAIAEADETFNGF